jgi:hypothetical protein
MAYTLKAPAGPLEVDPSSSARPMDPEGAAVCGKALDCGAVLAHRAARVSANIGALTSLTPALSVLEHAWPTVSRQADFLCDRASPIRGMTGSPYFKTAGSQVAVGG